jgi:(S)-2-hydroxyglutarate dehydrogenase
VDTRGRVVCVRNAPSPAATSSLAIAEFLYDNHIYYGNDSKHGNGIGH